MKPIFTFLLFVALHCGSAFAELSFPGETIDEWHGFKLHNFQADGCAAWVVEPKTALPGLPWSWSMEFPDAFTERCAAPQLLAAVFTTPTSSWATPSAVLAR